MPWKFVSCIHKQKPLFLWIFIQKMKEHFLWLREKTGAQTEKKYCLLRYGMVDHMLPISKKCNVITHKCGCFLLWLTLWTPYLHHKCAIFLAKKKPCEALPHGGICFCFSCGICAYKWKRLACLSQRQCLLYNEILGLVNKLSLQH